MMPAALGSVVDSVVAMVNNIKTIAVKTRFLKSMCQEAGACQETLTSIFVDCSKARYSPDFMNWRMTYYKLCHIFENLNNLNIEYGEEEKNLFISSDRWMDSVVMASLE